MAFRHHLHDAEPVQVCSADRWRKCAITDPGCAPRNGVLMENAVAVWKPYPSASFVAFVQVRSAYRRRGWGFTDPQQIAQCAKEGFVEKLREQAGEGCHLWGVLNVNKARARCWQRSAASHAKIAMELLCYAVPPIVSQPNVLQKAVRVCSCLSVQAPLH